MANKDTGGAAFPVEAMEVSETGMTLRDYFAAKAMQVLLTAIADKSVPDDEAQIALPTLPAAAYQMADAMLEARNK